MEEIPDSFGNVWRCIARRPWIDILLLPIFSPLFLVTWWRLPLETHFRSPPSSFGGLSLFLLAGAIPSNLPLVYPPSSSSSRPEEEDQRGGNVFFQIPCCVYAPSSSCVILSAPLRCPSLTFQIGLGLQRLLSMDLERSPTGLRLYI